MNSSFPYRIKKGLLNTPAFFKATQSCIVFDASELRPLKQIHSNIMNNYHVVTSHVIRLLFSCSPFAVCGKVSFIVINSFYGMFVRWPLSHIGKKYHEIVFPFIANSYATTTIIFEILIVRILATLQYAIPYFIFRGITQSVLKARLFNFLFLKTSTASCVSASKVVTTDNRDITTGAFALPVKCILPVVINSFKNIETIKDLSGKINEIVIGHKRILQAKVASILGCGRRLLECRFSDALSYPQSDSILFHMESQY